MNVYIYQNSTEKILKNAYIGEYIPNFATKWPCPDWFHVPLTTEWATLISTMWSLSSNNYSWYNTKLHMPLWWARTKDYWTVSNQWSVWYYWSNTPRNDFPYVYYRYLSSSYTMPDWADYTNVWFSIRPFKNEFVEPDSTWTAIQWTVWGNGIFWNQTDWLISIIYSTNKITISDKNCWATTVYNSWNTLSEANCGKYYQWGNNYWFPYSWSVTTSSTRVNASTYWPWNYYESSTFITWTSGWDSSANQNLWWYVTWNVPV